MVNDDDVEITVHTTKPIAGMRHSGIYPSFIDAVHIPTGATVRVPVTTTQMAARTKAIAALEVVLQA